MNDARIVDALARARRWSPFLDLVATREPAIVAAAEAGRIDWSPMPIDSTVPIGRRLRQERRALALKVALGDLAGVLDLTAVTQRLSNFADYALDAAIRAAIAERYPGDEPRGFVAIALGKQGSRELNYSSDIDPILLYDPETLPRRAREEPEEAAVADVFGTLAVVVGVIRIWSISMPNSAATTCATLVKRPCPISVPPWFR